MLIISLKDSIKSNSSSSAFSELKALTHISLYASTLAENWTRLLKIGRALSSALDLIGTSIRVRTISKLIFIYRRYNFRD
jgi:hypothetical protein